MNINMQICGLIIISLILYFIYRNRTFTNLSNRLFLVLTWLCAIGTTFDILSVYYITNAVSEKSIDNFNGMINQTTHFSSFALLSGKLYIISLVDITGVAVLYMLSEIKKSIRSKVYIYIIIIIATFSVLIGIAPINFYSQNGICYSYGPATIITYAACIIFIFSNIICAIKFKGKLSHRRRQAMLVWFVIWLFAALIQFFKPELLLVSFASCIGIVILFFELENPIQRLERQSGFFNTYAMIDYMKFLNEKNESYVVLAVSPQNELQSLDSNKFNSYADKNFAIFKSVDDKIYFISKDYNRCHNIANEFKKIFQVKIAILLSAEKIPPYNVMHYLRDTSNDWGSSNIYEIDYNTYLRFYEISIIKRDIEKAIEENRIVAFFQPIYDVSKQKFTSAEVLCRMVDEQGKIIPPGKFIPVAEETGQIKEIEIIVLKQVCNLLKTSNILDYGIEYIEANLSIKKGEEQNLYNTYNSILSSYNLANSYINLEVTETAILSEKEALLKNMYEMSQNGFMFSLDDFGTGQSNLGYVIDMPVSIVKFDKTIIDSYLTNPKAQIVVKNAIQMVHELGMKVVTEGIETKDSLDKIIKIGADYIQGYYFSKPINATEFEQFIYNNNSN